MDRVREIVISRKEVLDQFVWWYNTNDNLLYKYENGWELVIGKASQTQDGLMSKEDKILLDTYTGVASATTIAGYGITDAYTKTEVDTFIDNLGAASMIEESVESYETFDDFPLPAYAKEDTIYIDLTTNLIYYWAEDSQKYVLITNKDNVIYISNPNDILEIPNLDSEVTEGLYKVKHVKGTEVLNYTLNIKRAGTTITQVLQSFEFYATRKKYGSWLVWEKFEYAYTQNLVEFSIPPATSETKINLGIKDNKYYRYKFTVNNLNLVYTADICKQGSVIEFTTSADFTPDKFSWANGFTDSTQTVPLFTDLYGEPIGPNTKVIIFYQRNVMQIRQKRITSVVDIDGHLGINRTTGATTTFLNQKGGFSEIIIPVVDSDPAFAFKLISTPLTKGPGPTFIENAVVLKRSTETRISTLLTDQHIINISLETTEVANRVNEYALIFKTGASSPSVLHPGSTQWPQGVPTIEQNRTYIILYKRVRSSADGAPEVYDTIGLLL